MGEVEEIKKIIATIKKRIKTIEWDSADIQQFFTNNQKTHQDLLSELSSLLADITALIDTPKRFLNLFTSTERQSIHAELNNLDNHIEHVSLESISNLLDGLKIIIRSVYARYTESKYDELDKRSLAFEKWKEKFTTKMEDSLTEAKSLIDNAKTALEYSTITGMSAGFRHRLRKIEPETIKEGKYIWWKNRYRKATSINTLWILGSIAFVCFAIYLSHQFIEAVKDSSTGLSLNAMLARLSAVGLPVAGAWFCAGQYIKIKNIAEDYAYKTVLAESILGFSEQLKDKDDKDNKVYKDYIKKVLAEIHHHPLKNHKKYNENKADTESLINKIKDLIKPQE